MSGVITDGLRGYTAGVDSNGSLQTRVHGTAQVAVADPVSTQVATLTLSTVNRGASIGTTSEELASAVSGRQSIYISNNGPNPVHIRFGTDSATADDFLIPSGERVAFERVGPDAIQAIATGGATTVAVVEWKRV